MGVWFVWVLVIFRQGCHHPMFRNNFHCFDTVKYNTPNKCFYPRVANASRKLHLACILCSTLHIFMSFIAVRITVKNHNYNNICHVAKKAETHQDKKNLNSRKIDTCVLMECCVSMGVLMECHVIMGV